MLTGTISYGKNSFFLCGIYKNVHHLFCALANLAITKKHSYDGKNF